uniref:DJ-1/PfpI domain-containing protein n=1 Tax=Craspedostauros australis TaxID=1486917 RepID=A0A7S0F701_9STRA|mmetsp:Transcript_8562/g.23123  ORF Transcript_8562/g.23123 Transcript_8562/m.23123 type:complete len:228 (+) Transcript_8562:123-806(+)|eukprot:CAMPEP_0198114092 /NCGR_PEP_ID=MMETSP1442-20131203/5572_1 /TAXON_ID= /ORGANISM="Craspedostauros australis, Strain CCMP3328" /LENGTH=227 /DNA_ID=CAMNT_0043771323 /DNA_START=98 /DNA_END=781 /DNA_ORIENTATION=+
MVKIVLISTSAPILKETEETGVWMEEIAAPYYKFVEAGYEVTIASPAGGAIPVDAGSLSDPFFTDASKKFLHDATAMGKFMHSKKLETLQFPSDYDAIYMPGGHGCCVDFIDNATLKSAIETMYNAGKIVATVCHGPICLCDCETPDGKPFVQGKTVTGFADSEEEAVQKVELVPYLIETRFKEQGANYEKADDWNSKVCIDGNLITGQNPQSSEAAAEAVIKALAA